MNVLSLILASTGNFGSTLSMSNPIDDTMSVLASAEARIIGASLSHLASETKRNADAVEQINQSLRVLTRLEQAHGTVLDKLKEGSMRMTDHEGRLLTIEKYMPGLLETRKWVVGGVLAGIAMIGGALFKLVILDVPRIPQYVVQQPMQAPIGMQPSPQQYQQAPPPQPQQAPQRP